jgi:hypothetical protein
MEPALITDGEAGVMNQVFEEEVLQAFEDAKCSYGKGVPSGTSKCQEWDVGKLFMHTKTGVKTIVREGIDVSNAILENNLEVLVFQKFQSEFPNVPISADFRKKKIYGVCVWVYVGKKHWTPYLMSKSVIETGFHRRVKLGEPTINFKRLMTKTVNQDVTEEDLNHMDENKDIVADKLLEEGK